MVDIDHVSQSEKQNAHLPRQFILFISLHSDFILTFSRTFLIFLNSVGLLFGVLQFVNQIIFV